LEPAAKFISRLSRHHYVRQNQVGSLAADLGLSLIGIFRSYHLIAAHRQPPECGEGVAATTECSSPGEKLSAALKLSGDRLAKACANAPGKSRHSILQNF